MKCPRCGTECDGWPCPKCGFPTVMKFRKVKELAISMTEEDTADE